MILFTTFIMVSFFHTGTSSVPSMDSLDFVYVKTRRWNNIQKYINDTKIKGMKILELLNQIQKVGPISQKRFYTFRRWTKRKFSPSHFLPTFWTLMTISVLQNSLRLMELSSIIIQMGSLLQMDVSIGKQITFRTFENIST